MKKIILFIFLLAFQIFISCSKSENVNNPISQVGYTISGTNILNTGKPIQLIGANAFHSFGASSTNNDDMKSWNLDITREFIGNIKENPITGDPIQDSNGSWLHSLQKIVDGNRLNNRITILCAFGWNGTSETLFTGKMPAKTAWFTDYKTRLQSWANQFKNQSDVWIEVWNEPYRYDRTDEYTDAIWMNDMNEMTAIIRNTGNKNIILIPCAEQGQDESVLINKGSSFLSNKTNILFDIHAYEKWLLDSNTSISSRLDNLQTHNLPVIFGETAPINSGALMNPEYLLNELYNRGKSICAWTWKYDENDKDALLTLAGLPNNTNNNNWGTTFRNLSSKARNP
jgi:mannan endo-1,4-beta-mannosidase